MLTTPNWLHWWYWRNPTEREYDQYLRLREWLAVRSWYDLHHFVHDDEYRGTVFSVKLGIGISQRMRIPASTSCWRKDVFGARFQPTIYLNFEFPQSLSRGQVSHTVTQITLRVVSRTPCSCWGPYFSALDREREIRDWLCAYRVRSVAEFFTERMIRRSVCRWNAYHKGLQYNSPFRHDGTVVLEGCWLPMSALCKS